ncbi:MAG: hypothetical protein ABI623_01725 [bacterium]
MKMPAVDEKKKTILIYSPDLNFCFSLAMLFQNKFNVITTTDPLTIESFVVHYSANLLIVDAVPSEKMREQMHALKQLNHELPIIALYVYSSRGAHLDQDVRKVVDSVFYKPFDLPAVSKRINDLLST